MWMVGRGAAMSGKLEICPRCRGPISPLMRNCTRGCGYVAPPIELPPLVAKEQR